MKKFVAFLIAFVSIVSFSSCSKIDPLDNLIKCSTFTNRMSNYSRIITFSDGNKYQYQAFGKVYSGTFNEVYEYNYEYYVKNEVLTHTVHKKDGHVKIYSLNGLKEDGKQTYFGYDNNKVTNSAYSYYRVSLFSTNESITPTLLDSYRKELDNVVVSNCYGPFDPDRPLYHYIKGKEYVPIKSVTLNQNSFDIKENETVKIEATVSPRIPTDQYYDWAIDDENVAQIESKGSSNSETNVTVRYCSIKGLNNGTTNVHFLCGDNKSVTIPITVRPVTLENLITYIQPISQDPKIHPTTLNTFYTNSPVFLKISPDPEDALIDQVKWEITNQEILSKLDLSGSNREKLSIVAKEAGDVNITIRVGNVHNSITLHFIQNN